jgi:hypothetical protein
MRALRYIPLFVIVGALATAALAERKNTDWSPVVYPEQRLPLIFSHAKHAPTRVAAAPNTKRCRRFDTHRA